jgi:hypothetical protein
MSIRIPGDAGCPHFSHLGNTFKGYAEILKKFPTVITGSSHHKKKTSENPKKVISRRNTGDLVLKEYNFS